MSKNPFMPGRRVVCIVNSWNTIYAGSPEKNSLPKKGELLIVDKTNGHLLSFEKHNVDDCTNWFHHNCFAPAQDATEMESDETGFANYEEMTA